MRFQILGPLSLTDGPDSVVLQPSKPTILLATLLLHANSVVSAAYLQRTIWGAEQPATAKAALQTCVLRLRRLFAKHGVTQTPIEAVPGGYRITADTRTLDLVGFRERVGAAALAADPESELYALKEALTLWQGSLLANVPSDVLHRDEVPRLVEERLRTVERACDLELALGRCGQALVELWGVTRAHPGHERFREQLIEALYRSGRQAEALAEYRDIKGYLRDELGVDPSPALQRLELAILRGDDLGRSGAGRPLLVRVDEAPADDARGALGAAPAPLALPGGGSAAGPLPAAVPAVAAVPSFAGREEHVTAMAERLSAAADGPVTLLVSGAPGIGKTALARQVAHLVRDRFPGGSLLVRMSRPDGGPRHAGEVAAEVAAALDGDGGHDARVLLVLDDVTDADQARDLLPSAPGAAAIVTSRRGLAGLVATHGAWVHRLDAFSPGESHDLLVAALGRERVEAEAEAALRLARTCGHYPLALRITTAWLLTRPALRLGDAADWLAEDPLARLCLGEEDPRLSVDMVLGAALDRLDRAAAEAFGQLGTLPPEGFRTEEAAAELGVPPDEVAPLLARLTEAGLIEDGPPGPYRIHALLGVYARSACTGSRSRPRQKV
jgi:DNA-binding SARP family transcriptional activator